MDKEKAAETGIGVGSVLAMIISWSINHSIGWAIVHGIFSWGYVIYFVITRGKE